MIIERSIEPPRCMHRGGSVRSERLALVALVLAAVVTRIVTTIHYVEDLDSLHFAMSMIEFDVARLQPHFPGYIVFVGLARLFAAAMGSFAPGFSLVGALASVVLVLGLLRLARIPLASSRGAFVALAVLGNGMLWLYANRYMPDLLGAALLVWSLADLTNHDDRPRARGALAAALLAGTRLSYLPFLLPVALFAARWRSGRGRAALVFVVGLLLWVVPLVALTGWSEIAAIAANQTNGHFDEFGGTIRTEPNVALRIGRMTEGLWTDALGGWTPERSSLTALSGLAALVGLGAASSRLRAALMSPRWILVAAGIVTYLLWIFLYQNVIHHSRHLLPLVPFLALAVGIGLHRIARHGRLGLVLAIALLTAHCALGAALAWQHRRPTAIAQVSRVLAADQTLPTVVSTALVNYYLESTGVRARFVAVDREGFADSLAATAPGARLISVGDYRGPLGRPVVRTRRFFHNPHVNRIWPQVQLYEYGMVGATR